MTTTAQPMKRRKCDADLFSKSEVSRILHCRRETVMDFAEKRGVCLHHGAGKAGHLISREEVLVLAAFLKTEPDWSAA